MGAFLSFAKLQSEEVTSDSVKKKNNSAITNQPTSITAVLEKDNVIDAEMRWCLKVVKSKFSQRSCDDMQSLFSVMFPEIARKMTLQKDKCKYVINHGPAPYYGQLLIQNVTASPYHSLLFDDSLNKKIHFGQMDLYARFWNVSKELAETWYFTSQFPGCAKANDFLEKFEIGVSKKIHKANDA